MLMLYVLSGVKVLRLDATVVALSRRHISPEAQAAIRSLYWTHFGRYCVINDRFGECLEDALCQFAHRVVSTNQLFPSIMHLELNGITIRRHMMPLLDGVWCLPELVSLVLNMVEVQWSSQVEPSGRSACLEGTTFEFERELDQQVWNINRSMTPDVCNQLRRLSISCCEGVVAHWRPNDAAKFSSMERLSWVVQRDGAANPRSNWWCHANMAAELLDLWGLSRCCQNLRMLDVSNMGISTLKGLEGLVHLERLDISNNRQMGRRGGSRLIAGFLEADVVSVLIANAKARMAHARVPSSQMARGVSERMNINCKLVCRHVHVPLQSCSNWLELQELADLVCDVYLSDFGFTDQEWAEGQSGYPEDLCEVASWGVQVGAHP